MVSNSAIQLEIKNQTARRIHTHEPVSEWCNNKTVSATKELILIVKINISDGDKTLVVLLHEVESRLLQPFKITR